MRFCFPTLVIVCLWVPGCSDGDQQRIADLENQLEETRVAEMERQAEETRVAEMERQLENERIAKLEEDRKKRLELQRTGGGERVVERHGNGQKKSEGYMLDDGTEVGLWTYWNSYGQKRVEADNTDMKYVITDWYENGQKAVEAAYTVVLPAELPVGVSVDDSILPWFFYDSPAPSTPSLSLGIRRMRLINPNLDYGAALYSLIVKLGTLNGVLTLWYESGQKKVEETYKDGKRNGVRYEWHESGQKKSEETYKDGRPDGVLTMWYESGHKKVEETYKNGRPDGVRSEWYENGQKKSE